MSWSEHVDSLVTGTHTNCQIGCATHRHTAVPIDLSFSNRYVPDYPQLPDIKFRIDCFVEPVASSAAGYCPGRGEVSRSIRSQGIWEGYDTGLAISILEDKSPGIFMDFGSNVGWYSIIARGLDRNVLAFEADPHFIQSMEVSMSNNGFNTDWMIVHGWIDEDTPSLPIQAGLDPAPHVRLVKSDTEGAECHVIHMLQNFFEHGMIDYMMLELSPMFGGWEETQDALSLRKDKYELFKVPDKGYDPVGFAANPLGSTINTLPLNPAILSDQVTGLLVRRDLL